MKKLICGLVACGVSIGAHGVASAAAPPTNGCATENRSSDQEHGMLYFAVADLAALGYRLRDRR